MPLPPDERLKRSRRGASTGPAIEPWRLGKALTGARAHPRWSSRCLLPSVRGDSDLGFRRNAMQSVCFNGRSISRVRLGGLVAAAALAISAPATAAGQFNQAGNILITDQFNNRVIEVDPAGNIVWQFGNGPGDTAANAIVGTNDAERVGDLTLMAGTGIPAGATKNCKKSGCADNRVLIVDRLGSIVWQYGMNGVAGNGPHQLNSPNSAELLANGDVLIADEANNRAIEVTHTNPSTIVATFTAGGTVSGAAFASRLPNGNTLITDSNNGRIVEVDASDNAVWQFL